MEINDILGLGKVLPLDKLLDIISISIQLTGSIILFYYSPINKPDGAFVSNANPDYKNPKKRNKHSK